MVRTHNKIFTFLGERFDPQQLIRTIKGDADTKHCDNKQTNMADTVRNNSKKYVNK
jgi:hypothetical protein